jgi:hypothetical protein
VDTQHLDRSDHLKMGGALLENNTRRFYQHLDRSDHLKKEGALLGDNTSRWIRSTWIAPITWKNKIILWIMEKE